MELCTDFLWWFRSNFFAYFSSFPRSSNISIRKTLERIRISYLFSENDLKHEITLAKNLLRRESKLPTLHEQFLHSYLKTCVWLFLRAVTFPVTNASCERTFSKLEPVKTFPRNSMTRRRLGNVLIYFQLKGVSWKIDLDDFVDEFDSRDDNRRMKLHWVDDDIKF